MVKAGGAAEHLFSAAVAWLSSSVKSHPEIIGLKSTGLGMPAKELQEHTCK